jgi:hypothetical protein
MVSFDTALSRMTRHLMPLEAYVCSPGSLSLSLLLSFCLFGTAHGDVGGREGCGFREMRFPSFYTRLPAFHVFLFPDCVVHLLTAVRISIQHVGNKVLCGAQDGGEGEVVLHASDLSLHLLSLALAFWLVGRKIPCRVVVNVPISPGGLFEAIGTHRILSSRAEHRARLFHSRHFTLSVRVRGRPKERHIRIQGQDAEQHDAPRSRSEEAVPEFPHALCHHRRRTHARTHVQAHSTQHTPTYTDARTLS